MRTSKRLTNLVLVLFVLVFAQQAYALPISLYATEQQNWQGSTFYDKPATGTNGGNLRGRIDYAVYDKNDLQNPGVSDAEKTFVSSIVSIMPTSQYLYTYQIFNDIVNDPANKNSDTSIAYFAVFNLDKTALNVVSQNIGAENDEAGGIGPGYNGLQENNTRVVWNFAGHLILKGDHSWFLVFSSDSGPVKGDYDIKDLESSDFPSNGASIPEPATFMLLSAGSLLLAKRKRRK